MREIDMSKNGNKERPKRGQEEGVFLIIEVRLKKSG